MRTTFINTLTQLSKKNNDIFLLTGDMGFSVFENFRETFPNRFINVGIAESNMASIAAGMASCGKKVFIYSIIPFVTMRCFEQIKVDICYHNLDVIIVGVGGGFSYGSQGTTHHAMEDISIMRTLPNMKVFCPCDPFETSEIIKAVTEISGPSYIRLNKNNEPYIYKNDSTFYLGKGNVIKNGSDITLISTGNMVETAMLVSEELLKHSINARVISMHSIKPIDYELVNKCILETSAIFTIEEHNIIGGLGSAIAEIVAENCTKKFLFKRFGINDMFASFVGEQKYLRTKFGLSQNQISKSILKIINIGDTYDK